MKKINILYIISNMGAGGAQKVVLNSLSRLKLEDKFNVKLLVLEQKYNTNYEIELEKLNLNVEYLNLKFNKIPLLDKFFNLNFCNSTIVNSINKFKPDIIHIHLFGTVKMLSNSLSKCDCKKIFYTLHSDPRRFINIDLKIIKNFLLKYKVVPICLTEEQAKIAKKHYNIKDYLLLRNGIDYKRIQKEMLTKKEARRFFRFSNDDFIICTVGRLNKIKNYDFLLEVFKKILEKRPQALLVFAGDGEELQNLKNKSKILNIDKHVVFLGNISTCTKLYCASDVFILCSKSESTGLALIEAQICNIYSVISSGVPSESIITNKVNKMLVDSTIEDWSNAILSSKYNGNSVLDFDSYDLEKIFDEMKKIYIECLEENNGK